MPKCAVCQSTDGPLVCENCNGLCYCRDCADTQSSGGTVGHFCKICGNLLTEDTTHEREVQRIRKLIADKGGKAYVTDQGRRKQGSAGIPDLVAFVPVSDDWRLLWVDAKVGADTVRDAQEVFFEQCDRAGIPWVAGNVDDVRELLEQLEESDASNNR